MNNLLENFTTRVLPPEENSSPAYWFIFHQDKIVLFQETGQHHVPKQQTKAALGVEIIKPHYFGIWHQTHCFCATLNSPDALPDNFILLPLREAAVQLGHDFFEVASRGIQICQWDKNYQFCSRCGSSLQVSPKERMKICPTCALTHYPRISPSIIVLIKRGKEVLLARSSHFPPGIYSTLAGFIEAGENAEQAVAREVYEEVGIKIKNIQYRFSQTWPFPDSLMLGFTAEHAAGEIHIDGIEIEDAGWFTHETIPSLPSSISISRQLIELFIRKEF